ncbi:hypothetical protein BJ170DRAFT_724156 [Xylariales sp. AK1849]|nr:hypothetical protein BJ170DRAFT_724156 [Xylariales sp. AK1849]
MQGLLSGNPFGGLNSHHVGSIGSHNAGVSLGPEKGPIDRLPQILAFLRDQDRDRRSGFKPALVGIKKYLEYAKKLRREGLMDFDLEPILQECDNLVEVHETFETWAYGNTRWSTHDPPSTIYPKRLPIYDRQLPAPPMKTPEEKQPSVSTSLIPRKHAVRHTPFVDFDNLDSNPDWDFYFATEAGFSFLRQFTALYAHENKFWSLKAGGATKVHWEDIPLWKNPRNPKAINYHALENATFDHYMRAGLKGMVAAPGLQKPLDTAEFEIETKLRGWRRAAIQTCLNMLFNSENRDINTPWRRVILPEPVRKTTEVYYHPRALPRESTNAGSATTQDRRGDRCLREEPSPWIFWYNQYLEQLNFLSAWARQSYNKRQWGNFMQIALPPNYQGPYTFSNKCIYDDYWLKMGRSLLVLKENLRRTSETQPRRLIERVLSDISDGETGKPVPYEVFARVGVDTVPGKRDAFQLVDEIDVTWLKFLCQPTATRSLVGLSHQKPEDTLTILFDHRIQTLLSDINNPFWVRDKDPETQTLKWRSQQINLTDLVPMMNLGGRKDYLALGGARVAAELRGVQREPANKLHQFTLNEARDYCSVLARMNRFQYWCPCPPELLQPNERYRLIEGNLRFYPTEKWESEYGTVVTINPETFPESRIRWRYPSKEYLDHYNREYKVHFTSTMGARDRATRNPRSFQAKLYEDEFREEIGWKQGLYDGESVESRRLAPSWEDLVDYRTALEEDSGVSTKTTNFIRNLAYRMGRTIRHYRTLVERTSEPSCLTRKDLSDTLIKWQLYVDEALITAEDKDDTSLHPFKAAQPSTIIAKATRNADVSAQNRTEVFAEIRRGIIDDVVRNRTMLYPGRAAVYTDKREFLSQYFERANIWSWASEPIRRHHAVYRRERYFDMRRWPLKRQSEASQTKISSRADEDPALQPASAVYKYRLVVGPVTQYTARNPKTAHISPTPAILKHIRTLDSKQQTVALQFLGGMAQGLVKVMQRQGTLDDKWGVKFIPPHTQAQVKAPQTKLRPMVRSNEVFIPGPAVFPMGDTLLQQVKISQDLERILDPKPSENLTAKIMSTVTGWLKPAPDRVPLLPDIDINRVPTSNPRKRKAPSAFLKSAGPPKKIPAITSSSSKLPAKGVKAPMGANTAASMSLSAVTTNGTVDPKVTWQPGDENQMWIDVKGTRREYWRGVCQQIIDRFRGNQPPKLGRDDFEDPKALGQFSAIVRNPKASGPAGQWPVGASVNLTTESAGPKSPTASSGLPGVIDPLETPVTPRPPNTQGPAKTKTEQAVEACNKAFPKGFNTIPTQSTGFLCGFYAIIESMKRQFPNMPQHPEIDELQSLFKNPTDEQVAAVQQAVGLSNTSNFTADQLAAVLYQWGKKQGLVLQLGFVFDNSRPILMSIREEVPDHIVWIHQDGSAEQTASHAEAESAFLKKAGAEGLSVDQIAAQLGVTNHFSAVVAK